MAVAASFARDAIDAEHAVASPTPATDVSIEAASAAAGRLVAAAIEGIVVASGAGLLGGRESFDRALLLRSGQALLGLVGPPIDVAPPPIDAEVDPRWTRWRDADGGGHEVLDRASGLWRPLQGRLFEPMRAVEPAQLAGTLSRSRSRVDGLSTFTAHERLTLALDGSFSRTRSALATSASPAGYVPTGVGVPSVVHRPETAPNAGRLGGSYALLEDGFTLELVYADGTRERSLLLDDGGSRVLDGRRYTFSSADVDTIDLVALMQRWHADRRETKDWRAVIAEAMARGVEERALVGSDRSRDRARVGPAGIARASAAGERLAAIGGDSGSTATSVPGAGPIPREHG